MSDNAKLATSEYEAWNNRDFDAFSELMANGAISASCRKPSEQRSKQRLPGAPSPRDGCDAARKF